MGISLNPSTLLSGQGIDVSSLVQQIINAQSGPLTEWQTEETNLSTQAGLLLGINNNLISLATAVQGLTDPTTGVAAITASSSNSDVLTANAQSTAASGTHQITISNLATQSLAYSAPVANDSLGAGTLNIQVGNGTTTPVTITANETLEQLASAINDQNLGVTANVVTDANGSRLSLLSGTSGQPGSLTVGSIGASGTPPYSGVGNGTITSVSGGSGGVAQTITITAIDATHFSVTGSVSGALGAATAGTPFTSDAINFTLAAGSTAFQAGDSFTVATTAPPLSFTQVAGADAQLTVDGIPVNSASNTVIGAISGVTLNLDSADPGNPVELTVGTDPNQAAAAINNFISAYNTVIGSINTQFSVDPTTNSEGPLGSDVSLRSLQSSLLNDASYAISGNSGLVNLASLGVTTNNDGTLSLGITPSGQTTSQVLAANPAAFQNFFTNSAATGFADNFSADLSNLTDPTQGPLNIEIAQNSATQQSITSDINTFDTQIAAEQQQLTTQYDQVNASLQAYPLLLQEVTEVIGSLGSSSGSSTGSTATPILTTGL